MRFSGKMVALLIVVALLIGAGGTYSAVTLLGLGQNNQVSASSKRIIPAQGSPESPKVAAVHDLIMKDYYKKIDSKTLDNGAIQGMISALNDPFSDYFDPKTTKAFTQSLSSSFQGIGAEVHKVNNHISIVSPIKGSPAEKAGLKPNDVITEINGKSTAGLSLQEAVDKIKGKKGTTVKLGISRPGNPHQLTFSITRGDIPLKTVHSKIIHQDKKTIGYINITQFNENTDKEFNTELANVEKNHINGLIIDVRGDPGGYLQAVEAIASQFITKDKPIVQIEDRTGKRQKFYSSLTKKKPYPIVDMIDGGSASAAEILSAALNESGSYPLVGQKSFGKGTVQQGIQLSDKSELKLTIGKWLTPDGNWIHKKGIQPTVKVSEPDYFYAVPISLKKGQTLSYDHVASMISSAQKMLKGVGIDPGRTDGYYSKQTVAAVKAFQKKAKLKPTGQIDQTTAAKLQEQALQAVQNPKNDKQLNTAIQVLEKNMK